MISLGLTSYKMKELQKLLVSHHQIYIRMSLTDMNHRHIADLSKRLVTGQVTVDTTAETVRGLDCDLLDPTHSLELDSNSPADAALFADRMISVIYVVMNPAGTTSFDIPIFFGPVTSVERSGALLSVNAVGKEILGQSLAWHRKTYRKGTKKTSIIYAILSDIIGESKISMVWLNNKAPRNVGIGPETVPWSLAKLIANGMGYQLFFDGRGTARMRRRVSTTVFTFTSKSIVSEPSSSFNVDSIVNCVEVVGAKPKGKSQVRVRVVAAYSHPLSPWKLGRKGEPRYIPIVITDDTIKTKAAATKRAKAELSNRLVTAINVSFDAIPNPLVEEGDVVRISTDKFSTTFRMSKFTIPLTATGSSSIGYVRNVKPNARALRARS